MNITSAAALNALKACAFLALCTEGRATEVAATRDGITLTAKCNISPNGLTVVSCNIVNRSEHTLAFFDFLQYEYRLLDAAGNVVPQSVVWAKSFHQNGQRSGKGIHLIPGFLQPSEQIVSSFYLESAYEDRVNQGRVLEIAWENRWYGPEHEFSVPETPFPDGRIGPQHTEKSHFPGAWKLAVALPLPERKIGGAAPASSQTWDPAPPGWVVNRLDKKVTLAAMCAAGTTSNRHVTCQLANDSQFPIEFGYLDPDCAAFQFRLLDGAGRALAQEPIWAEQCWQRGAWSHRRLRTTLTDFVEPSGKRKFEVDLETAYGARAALGRVLEITWQVYNSERGGYVNIPPHLDAAGTLTPASCEPDHFRGDWELKVVMTLPPENPPDGSSDTRAAQALEQPPAHSPGGENTQQSPTSQSRPSAAAPGKDVAVRVSPWWWALVAIPLLLLAWLGLRLRNPR